MPVVALSAKARPRLVEEDPSRGGVNEPANVIETPLGLVPIQVLVRSMGELKP